MAVPPAVAETALRTVLFGSPVAWSMLSLAGEQRDTYSVWCCSEPGIWNWRVHIMQNELSTSIQKPLCSWTFSSMKKKEKGAISPHDWFQEGSVPMKLGQLVSLYMQTKILCVLMRGEAVGRSL